MTDLPGACNIRANGSSVDRAPRWIATRGFRVLVLGDGGGIVARVNTRRMRQLRRDFFEEGRRFDADPRTRDQSVCWLCGQRIDYDAAPGTSEDSHELDHAVPVSEAPDLQEEPSNFRHAHRRCNAARGNRAPSARLSAGAGVAPWW